MKQFSILCKYGNIKRLEHICVGDHPHPGAKNPIAMQAYWLDVTAGSQITPDTLTSFEKLLAIARENNVSFEDLCVYALGDASKEKEKAIRTASAGKVASLAHVREYMKQVEQDSEDKKVNDSPPAIVPSRRVLTGKKPGSSGDDLLTASSFDGCAKLCLQLADLLFSGDTKNVMASRQVFLSEALLCIGLQHFKPNINAVYHIFQDNHYPHSKAVQLDTIGELMPEACYRIFQHFLFQETAFCHEVRTHIIGRLHDFALNISGIKLPNSVPIKRLQRNLYKTLMS